MNTEVHWVRQGRLCGVGNPCHDRTAGEWRSLQHRGLVRVVSGPVGTEIKWVTFSPCHASLIFVSDWLSDLPSPYMLRYFLAGWLEEEFRAPEEAHDRIIDIIARADIHLMRRVFVQQGDPARNGMPPSLRGAWGGSDDARERFVDCRYDETVGQFRVIRVGRQSTIGKLWGTAPSTYPCANGGIYDRTVGAAYWDVVQTGAPRYDHVYAAMRMPSGELVWIPYQRVILPGEGQRGAKAVRVLTEIAKVDISII